MHGSKMSNTLHLTRLVLAGLLGGGIALPQAMAQSPQATEKPATQPAKPQAQSAGKPRGQPDKAAGASTAHRYHPDRFAGRAGSYYRLVWGVDSLDVKSVESGEVIRFTYRVLDPNK